LRQEIKKLKEELDKMKKSTLSVKEQDDLSSRSRTLERAYKSMKSEKNQLVEEITLLKQSLTDKEKELKEVKKSYNMAEDELTHINDKYKSQKRELTRAIREKDEEIEDIIAKMESLRKSSKENEREKRNLLSEVDDLKAELTHEKKQRARFEKMKKELEEEVESLSRRRKESSTGINGQEYQKTIQKLQAQLEEKDNDHSEAIKSMESQHSTEIQSLKGQLTTSENANTELRNDINELEMKITKTKTRITEELKQEMKELTKKHYTEKQQLTEKSKELSEQLEILTSQLEETKSLHKKQEDELKETKQSKELLSQWEHQIAEIVQLVSEEKNARSYLQSVAKRLVDDVEGLKSTSSTIKPERWHERRTMKRDKQERVEMQQNLEIELKAKQELEKELRDIRTQLAHTESKVEELESVVEKITKDNEKLMKENQKFRMGLGSRNDSFSATTFFHQATGSISESTKSNPTPRPKVNTGNDSRESVHELVVRSFDSPTKCDACTSVMFGLVRQGMMCKNCQMSCHVHCKDKITSTCPLPPGMAKLPSGIDIHHGVGTACEGLIQVPRPGGVKKGWTRAHAFVCDFKIFFHEPSNDAQNPANSVFNIFDIRDINFRVSKVTRQDVIHAGEKLIPTIFKISCSQPTCSNIGIHSELLVRTDNEADRDKWVATLEELQKAAKQSSNKMDPIVSCHGLYSSQQLQLLKTITSSCIVNNNRLLLGAEDGLYMFDVADEGLYQCADKDIKKVIQLAVLPDENLIIILAGRRVASLRLLPLGALDSGDMKNVVIEISETKGAHLFCTGNLGPTQYICVAVKDKVLIFELNRTKLRHEKKKEVSVPGSGIIHALSMFNEKLCVGYQSGFSLFNVYLDEPERKLVNSEDLSLGFIRINDLNAMRSVELNNGQEYLLCFHFVGIYVNSEGKRSRREELLWHSPPTDIEYRAPHLIVFCESNLEVYNVETAKWIQTISIKKMHSISPNGTIALCQTGDLICTVYVKALGDTQADDLHLPNVGRRATVISKSKRAPRPPVKAPPQRPVISGPMEFTHVQHYGPHHPVDLENMPDAGADSKLARQRGQSIPVSMSTQSIANRKDFHSQLVTPQQYRGGSFEHLPQDGYQDHNDHY
jgi:serine/threonine-protein kinase MRCK